jgi:hypothetical protein
MRVLSTLSGPITWVHRNGRNWGETCVGGVPVVETFSRAVEHPGTPVTFLCVIRLFGGDADDEVFRKVGEATWHVADYHANPEMFAVNGADVTDTILDRYTHAQWCWVFLIDGIHYNSELLAAAVTGGLSSASAPVPPRRTDTSHATQDPVEDAVALISPGRRL